MVLKSCKFWRMVVEILSRERMKHAFVCICMLMYLCALTQWLIIVSLYILYNRFLFVSYWTVLALYIFLLLYIYPSDLVPAGLISLSTFCSEILPLQQMAEPHVVPILSLLTVTLYLSYILVFFTNHFSFCLCLLILKHLCSNGDVVLRIGTFTVNSYYIVLW